MENCNKSAPNTIAIAVCYKKNVMFNCLKFTLKLAFYNVFILVDELHSNILAKYKGKTQATIFNLKEILKKLYKCVFF